MAATTEYVLVIHGTWNRPEPGKPPKWYQLCPADTTNFCTRLAEHLQKYEMAEAVWRGHEPGREFAWSGENTHEDRLSAAHALCELFTDLAGKSPRPRVHVVAHSHGGNVLLKAIELYYGHIWERATTDARKVEGVREWLDDRGKQRHAAPPALQEFMSGRLTEESVLGRVVFLGTPFLEKRWDVARGLVDWFLRNTTAAAKALPTIGGGMYVAGMVWAYIIAAVIKAAGWILGRGWLAGTWPAFNPLAWSTAFQLLFVVFLAMAFLMLFFEDSRWNANYYFDERTLERRFGATAPRIPALIVTARYLDEALLFLSAEPLAHVFIVSRVLNRLRGTVRWKPFRADALTPRRVGENPEALRSGTTFVDVVAQVIGAILKLLSFPIWWGIRKAFLERATTRLVIDALESAAFGLPMEEVRSARVEVKETPDLTKFFAEKLWRTQALALSEPPPPPPAAGSTGDRYAHLTDDDALGLRRMVEEEKGRTAENTWTRLKMLAPSIYLTRNPAATREEIEAYTQHLARLWFTVEARASELGGSVELVHSLYYSNPTVVTAVAAFLATGEAPKDALDAGPPLEVVSASANVAAV